MFHVTHLVLILSLAVGVAAIVVSAEMYRRFRLGFLRSHLMTVVTFDLMILISLIVLYMLNLPRGTVSEALLETAVAGHLFAVPLLQLLAAFFFVQIIRGLLGKTVPAGLRDAAWAILGGYAVIQGVALAASLEAGGVRVAEVAASTARLLALGGIYVVLIGHLPQVGKVERSERRKAVRAYVLIMLALMSAVIALVVLRRTGLLAMRTYNLVSALMILAMNAIPVVYLRWFALEFHGKPQPGVDMPPRTSARFEEYGISPREREIVKLIYEGKTNRQIADELFISLQTVKDHVYRVYRKTNVKNRVQLVTLFMRDD
jgi:DNA-binding CsgD family transcriptional regulator